MSKKRLLIIIIVAVFLIAVLPWILFACGTFDLINDSPSPNAPLITYAEFPFSVTYELNGEEITYNDTVICRYKGDEWSDAHSMKFRNWEESYRNGAEIILYQKSPDEYVVLNTGFSAEYLMGDTEHFRYSCSRQCSAYLVKQGGLGSKTTSFLSEEDLYNIYGIKISSFEIAPPIENSLG